MDKFGNIPARETDTAVIQFGPEDDVSVIHKIFLVQRSLLF